MNILIVDDDELLVKKIVDGVLWEELGIDMTFTANNIRQARKLLEEYPIQILLSDIEMPQGNGLELLEWIREQKLPVRSIILSSYAHFPYAQKAMVLNTCDYLLKPASNRELTEAIRKAADSIHAEKEEEVQSLAEQKHQYWTHMLLDEGVQEPESVSLYGPEDSFYLWMLVLKPDEGKKNVKDKKLLSFVIEKAVNEFFESHNAVCEGLLKYGEHQWVLLSQIPPQEAEALKDLLKGRLESDVSFFGKRKQTELDNIPGVAETLYALSEEAVIGQDGILYIEDWNKKAHEELKLDWEAWSREFLFSEDLQSLEDKIHSLLEEYWMKNQLTVTSLKGFYREFLQMIFRWFEYNKISFTQIFGNEEFDSFYLNSMQSITETITFIRWTFQKIDAYRQAEGRQDKLIEKLKQYIEIHLKEDLSRKELANVVFLSEDYVSRIFVNGTGMSITNYITECRMKKAREYLVETDLSVSRIAMQVGYTNFSYFSKMFRKVSGYTPNEFRSRFNRRHKTS